MLNRIIKFSLHNRIIVLLLSAILLVGGMMTLLNTEVDIFPDLNAPTVTVMTEAPGLATEEVEQLVTYPIEMAVNGAQGVEVVRSVSNTGFSVVNIQFTGSTDILVARQTIAERLALVAGQLPPTADTPVIGPQSSILGEVLIIGLTSDSLSMAQLRTIADRRLRPALQGIRGVSQVSVIGGEELEYQIRLDQALLKHFGLSLDETIAALEDANRNPSGNIITGYGNEYIVKGDLSTTSTDELSQIVIRSDDSGIVTVGDVAEVTTGAKLPILGAASYRGKPAVIMTVTKQPGVGTIELTERLLGAIDKTGESLPRSLHIATDIFAQRDFIDNSISNLGRSLFEGALMVIIVLFFFMMNVRVTMVSLIALPMSILMTVLILHFLGITINTMTLGGIAIAIGSLVDDAIVDVENVNRRLRENRALPEGERRNLVAVVYSASKEVRTPIFNSSLIIVAGFMPLFFLSGVEGRMLVPLGIAFVISLAASTIIALTLTPVICSYLLGGRRQQERISKEPRTSLWIKGVYSRALGAALRHKKIWIGSVSGLFAVAIVLFFTLGRGFLPPFNEGSFTINVSALPGISLEESDRVGRMAEEIIMSVPEIKSVARKTGRAELDEHSLAVSVSEIEAPYELSGRSRSEIAHELRDKLSVIPGVTIEIGQPVSHRIDAMLSGTEAAIVYKVKGDNLEKINAIATRIEALMKRVRGLEDIARERHNDVNEITVRPRRAMMAKYGVTPAQFNSLVETALNGKVISQVYEEGYPRDLNLIIDTDRSHGVESLEDLMVDTRRGKVPLAEIADIKVTTGPGIINREGVTRRVIVSANIEGRDVKSAVDELDRLIAEEISLPEGYEIVQEGQARNAAEASSRLVMASLLALVIIWMLLFYEFRSVRQSVIILVNMPLAMIGGVIILKISGLDLDIPAIIGFIALLGIATRNGMLLISRYNMLLAEGRSVSEAVMRGSVDRLLPIVMTALTSALALVPLAVNGTAAGNEIQSPLAIVILGGLASSTLLNLFIVPILFVLSTRYKKQSGGSSSK